MAEHLSISELVLGLVGAFGSSGLQIHRSHWVAHAGIERVERVGGKVQVWLIDGQQLPVSRAHLRRLREAGW